MIRATTQVLAAALLALLGAVPASVSAAPPEGAVDGEVVIADLVYPESVAIDADGTVYAAENLYGEINQLPPGEDPRLIYRDARSRPVAGVSVAEGVVTFASSTCCARTQSRVYRLEDGARRTVADIWDWESRRNPDRIQTYGYTRISSSCRAQAPRKLRTFRGRASSYVTGTALDGETTYVADTGANALFSVDGVGRVRTVAVLPVTRVRVTEELRRAEGLPRCSEGGWLRAGPAPQDVELGPDGNLYVTSAPYQNGLVDHGRIYRVSPVTGDVTRVASRLRDPRGLAVSETGTIYVAVGAAILELPPAGGRATFAEIPSPGDVELGDGYVYAARTDPGYDGHEANQGAVLRWPLGAGAAE